MASSSSLSPIVSQEEFKIFHNIDRLLYTRLILNLARDPAESMHVMALWLWLERAGHIGNLVENLLNLSDSLINSMANEAVLCLKCIQNDYNLNHQHNIPLIHSVSKTGLSLQFFHQNRLTILSSVSKIVSEVCCRAFEDISSQLVESLKAVNNNNNNNNNNSVLPVVISGNQFMGGNEGGHFGRLMHGYDAFDVSLQRQILNSEIGDVLSHIGGCVSGQEEKDSAPVDDRTIFLTFSKGYPISEDEVRDFFTRKHGDCIEAIYMQEVLGEDHQPLYARLVVHSPAIIRVILEGSTKAKFSINGKHVWARKYVRKNPKSPTQPSSPPQPRSPGQLSS